MHRKIVLATLLLAGTGAAVWFLVLGARDSAETQAAALFDRYCIDCHNGIDYAGSLSLDDKDFAAVGHDAETWERVVRKLKTGMMPPAGEPRPERAALDNLTAELESRLDLASATRPDADPTALRRLNRTEYANAIRDLLDLDVDASTLLPLDDSSEGFDNIATALGVSPSLIDSYIAASMKISRWAIGDASAPRTQANYTVPTGLAQNRHLDGMPLGTHGGIQVEHLFPLDAEYEFRIGRGFGRAGRVDFMLDGVPVDIGNGPSFRIPVSAGPHTLAAALVDTRRATGVDDIYSAPESTAGIQGIAIDGPLDATGVGDTPSRRRILVCEPESVDRETACAREILTTLASRAFRRPISAEGIEPLMAFFASGRAAGSFETGIQHALSRILVDPRFLYRLEYDSAALAPGTTHAVDDYELASRLSFFLWSSIPDDALLATAARGKLHDSAVLAAEVERMLADPKADALIDNFAAQWLFLRELESATPDAADFDDNLRQAMLTETRMLVASVMHDDLSILRLLDADFTFVDQRLAEHYGLSGIRGSHFRRISLPDDSPRRGLLGHGSILTITSVTNRTSPVIRGSWILGNLMGSPAPVPPPNVETTLQGDDGTAVALSVRERLEAHRANPVCASCHAIMDPIGFSLENFDLIGAWRDTDGGQRIDTRATLSDGTPVDGPDALRAALMSRSDAFVTTAAEKLMTYALGRALEYYDMPTIRAIVRQAAEEDYRFSTLILGVVQSEPFRTRVKGATD
jgi:mono/diheme cytochrome c family protein